MEPTIGIEPMNLILTKDALYRLSYVGLIWIILTPSISNRIGAGDEARTRDIQLGRLKLYQLSYSRPIPLKLTVLVKLPLFSATKSMYCRKPRSSTDSRLKRESPATGPHSGWWWGEDLNLRRHRRQIYSLFPLTTREPHLEIKLEPAKGLEPPTHWLQISSSTNWATLARKTPQSCNQRVLAPAADDWPK